VHHQDRYLQGVMPLMAAATGALLLALWRHYSSSGSGKGRTPSGGSESEDDQDEAGGP
jgi:hypothetical protein